MSTVDWKQAEQRWIAAWHDAKLFEAVPDGRPKYFVTFPYPYMNAYSHLGHFYTLMRTEAMARYKRLRGHNVLFPQGWHCTGTPIEAAAQRIREKEDTQWKIMRDMGFADADIAKFGDPEQWVHYFPKEYHKDYEAAGVSIDWRRSFITTSLNPHYDKFVRWQFRTLKAGNYVRQGTHPVVWCPRENQPVGDHARAEGEGETPQEYVLLKFKFEDKFIIAATLRPETVFGQTNLWVNPDVDYVIAHVDGEHWILSEPAILKLQQQGHKAEMHSRISGARLIGRSALAPLINRELPILPASFCNPQKGTGIVTSVPADAPDDYVGLRDLQRDAQVQRKYGLDGAMLAAIIPIPIITTKEYGEMAAPFVVEQMKIANQHDRDKLEQAKHAVYKAGFYAGVMNTACGKYAGKPVKDAKDKIKAEMLKKKQAVLFYELTGKVICRCLTACVVKIVENQWFVAYSDKKWKRTTHKALNKCTLYPEKSRQQFDYVLDWLNDWACTRELGIGTRMPWDEQVVIESLSDSTIYMAYYTIVHLLQHVPIERVDDAFFDYVFLEKGAKPNVPHIDEMRKEFDYWYPCDVRISGKDLIQNHLAFQLFHHTAIFPPKHWSAGISVNGHIMVDGEKMSKSKGNFLLVRDVLRKFGVDPARISVLSGGEGMDDTNFEQEHARSLRPKINQLYDTCTTAYNQGRSQTTPIDAWLIARVQQCVNEATEAMEQMLYRSALQKIIVEMPAAFKWYLRRCGEPSHKAVNTYVEAQLIMLSPFAPIVSEEAWKAIGKEGFVSAATWPKTKKVAGGAIAAEDIIEQTVGDIRNVLQLAKIEKPKRITIISSEPWKYTLVTELVKYRETRNPGDVIKALMQTELKHYGQDIVKLVPRLHQKVPAMIVPAADELAALQDAVPFFTREFGCPVDVVSADKSQEQKAKHALPAKPAIVVQ